MLSPLSCLTRPLLPPGSCHPMSYEVAHDCGLTGMTLVTNNVGQLSMLLLAGHQLVFSGDTRELLALVPQCRVEMEGMSWCLPSPS